MKPRPGETRAGCERPLRQTLQTLRSPGPTASGPRGIFAFPHRAPGVGARFRLPCGFGQSCPFSARAPGSGIRTAVGNCELERSAPACLRFQPDPSTLALDNLLTKRQTDASTGAFSSMQAFEHSEHAAGVLRTDTNSVFPHRKQPRFRASLRRDMDSRRFLASVLDRIGNEVLEKLHQYNLIGRNGWQRIGGYDGATLRDGRLQVQQRFDENSAAIDRGEAVLF